MNKSWESATSGFGERGQEPFGDIPTESEAFLEWGTTLDRHHPYKYELSHGGGQPMMIPVSRAPCVRRDLQFAGRTIVETRS